MIYQEYSSISSPRVECFSAGYLYGLGGFQSEESRRKGFYLIEEDINFYSELFLEKNIQKNVLCW